jgi:hypothetical protein
MLLLHRERAYLVHNISNEHLEGREVALTSTDNTECGGRNTRRIERHCWCFVCLFLDNGRPSESGNVLSNRTAQSLKLSKAWVTVGRGRIVVGRQLMILVCLVALTSYGVSGRKLAICRAVSSTERHHWSRSPPMHTIVGN